MIKFNRHKEKLRDTGEEIEAFELETRKGYAYGFLHKDIIKIHHIGTKDNQSHPIKGLMNILTRTFKTNKFIFQMVINNNLLNSIKGKIVKVPATAKGNPFEEEITEIHGVWSE